MPPLPTTDHLTWQCPAKINLRLAVVGQREDGYHELRSLVAPLSLADHLVLDWDPAPGVDTLTLDGPWGEGIPATPGNLVLRAVAAFRARVPFPGHLRLALTKHIPSGAGLGGGSSDAAGTLLALQTLWNHPLEPADLEALAVRLGADVPFFLHSATAIMRGIGDDLTLVPELSARLARFRAVVFKPSFGIATAWAYEALAARRAYQSAKDEEVFLAGLLAGTRRIVEAPFNAFRAVVDERYPTVPVLLDELNALPGVHAEMSGSGSACFALLDAAAPLEAVLASIREAWGPHAFIERVAIA